MKRTLLDPPEPFVVAPALALVPSVGQVSKLAALQASLHARREKVSGLRKEMERQTSVRDREALKRMAAEDAMIGTVLDWLHAHAPGEV